jgi:hypothetical protein
MELYDQQLSAAKIFLHGHTGPGSENDEPGEQDNGVVLFERRFHSFLMEPWTVEHLNLTCHDCGSESQDAWERTLYKKSKSMGWDTERLWLCSDCYAKREASQPAEEQMDKDEEEEST